MMKSIYCCSVALLLGIAIEPAVAAAEQPGWLNSVVIVEVTRKQYDYFQPWTKRMKTTQKTGIVVGESSILTTADEVYDRTLVRLQKGGRGKWWTGDVQWIDYHANLALITTPDPQFWTGLEPVDWAEPAENPGSIQIVRWRSGKLETRRAEFGQYTVDEGRLTYVPHLQLEVSSEIQGVGSGEPVISGSQVVGIISEQSGSKCTAIPTSFILPILNAQREERFRGLGYFDFYWQPAENPATLEFLKLEGEPRGVVVIDVPSKPGVDPVLKARDLLLEVDGFAIDIQGDYADPEYGHLSLENLSTRGHWAGDDIKMKIWRDGAEMEIVYRLPRADYASSLVPDAVYDQEPEYLMVGGLLFQPLTDAFLRGWGPDWKRRSPFRLYYYNNQPPTKERPALVLLSQVLPDIHNLGYQDQRLLVVDEVNGRKISRLQDLQDALQHPVKGFHVIDFVASDSLRRIVMDADTAPESTRRVLQRYGISKEFHFAPIQDRRKGVASTE